MVAGVTILSALNYKRYLLSDYNIILNAIFFQLIFERTQAVAAAAAGSTASIVRQAAQPGAHIWHRQQYTQEQRQQPIL